MLAEIVVSLLVLPSMGVLAAEGDYWSEFLGEVDFDQEQFARTLERPSHFYNPEEKMIYYTYSTESYRYATAHKGGVVHQTRQSFEYAIACLDSGVPELF